MFTRIIQSQSFITVFISGIIAILIVLIGFVGLNINSSDSNTFYHQSPSINYETTKFIEPKTSTSAIFDIY